MSLSWDDAIDLFDKIGGLPDNWDGDGSPKTNPLIWDAADTMLFYLHDDMPPPFTCPIRGGSLQFEWTNGDRHVEIEFIDESSVVILMHDSATGQMSTEAIPSGRLHSIIKPLNWLRAAS